MGVHLRVIHVWRIRVESQVLVSRCMLGRMGAFLLPIVGFVHFAVSEVYVLTVMVLHKLLINYVGKTLASGGLFPLCIIDKFTALH